MSSFYGKYSGIVVDIDDPDRLGRVRVRCPAVLGDELSSWALPSVPYTAPGLGIFQVPPVGTGVWVEFEGGDPDRPVYAGCFRGPDQEILVERRDCSLSAVPFVQVVEPRASWEDLILPKTTLDSLREIADRIRGLAKVQEEQGLDRRLWPNKATVLFFGPDGTGKTLAARVLANELGLDLHRIDLSLVVSKYIGETEKNLERVFANAETSDAILLFDEADALFGKRSEVKDAHDRYANTEIAYLLQRMEEYDGLAILASNLRDRIDAAFLRRLSYIVEFPLPDKEVRSALSC